jgi:hypothetical protein
MKAFGPPLSKVRTFLFGALAVVWFSEMVLWGFPALARAWTNVWRLAAPDDAALAGVLQMAHAVEAPAKGALGLMALFGLMSKHAATRTALLAAMALVPPLNIAFQFRAQGFPLGSVAVAATFSLILWGAFFWFKEAGARGPTLPPPSRWDTARSAWFAVNAAVLTALAGLFLFAPRTVLDLTFPCSSPAFAANPGALSSLELTSLAVGAHFAALSTATWLATIRCRSNPTLRRAVTIASTAHAALMLVFPLGQIAAQDGGACAGASVLIGFLPLLGGWLLFSAFSYHVHTRRAALLSR